MHLQPHIMERTLKGQLSNVHLLNSEATALSWQASLGDWLWDSTVNIWLS